MNSFSQVETRTTPRADVAAFEQLARALVGITLKSLSVLDGAVSVPQFRLLLALDGLGRVPSSALAEALSMAASSVTRLADRLQAAGLVERGSVEHSRSIVTVEVTARGRDLVTAVLDRRRAILEDVLDRMEPRQRELARNLAAAFVDLAGDAVALGVNGPVPL
ncbi:MarR family transcriptional regulator [Actinocrinis puniceicyclus]|uniref:MarR family transcriptional regulator n=1 Tax=Actinocrinis puniceicyclus TaxID=977794 RepID=A0A8J7WP77_9ACTN|nr:MarR family transcriptional regulator [Actinocrinis puniceicyclus]MBS2963362.1 MarR family transcriptional regulator [Actinocrinis puniceicyclus]